MGIPSQHSGNTAMSVPWSSVKNNWLHHDSVKLNQNPNLGTLLYQYPWKTHPFLMSFTNIFKDLGTITFIQWHNPSQVLKETHRIKFPSVHCEENPQWPLKIFHHIESEFGLCPFVTPLGDLVSGAQKLYCNKHVKEFTSWVWEGNSLQNKNGILDMVVKKVNQKFVMSSCLPYTPFNWQKQ